MMKLITRAVKAPLAYIAQLRMISFRQYLLISTSYSPSYPIMITASMLFTLMFALLLLKYVFTNPLNASCLSEFEAAAYILAILYPIQSAVCFICLTASIALSKENCWKISWIILFGPILSGFGFESIGFAMICLMNLQAEKFSIPQIFFSAGFINAIAYLYIAFLLLFLALVPLINFLHGRMQHDNKLARQNNNKQAQEFQSDIKKGCCSYCISIFYYFFNFLFVISASFVFLMKLAGPVLFTYLWIQMAMFDSRFQQSIQRLTFAAMIMCFFAPLGLMAAVLGVQKLAKMGKKKKNPLNDQQSVGQDSAQSKKPIEEMREEVDRKQFQMPKKIQMDEEMKKRDSEGIQQLQGEQRGKRATLL